MIGRPSRTVRQQEAGVRRRVRPRPDSRASRLLGRRLKLGAALAAASLLVAAWLGCSVEKHYALLSFFFDGVPDPAVLAESKDELWRVKAAGGVVFTHEPYAQEKCNDCHRGRSGAMLTSVGSSVCSKCHEGVVDEHRHMHGPVAAGACLWCHAPHEATVKPLLRTGVVQLCTQCHDMSLGRQVDIPEHSDPKRSCLDCHHGHGGESRRLLRARGG